MATIIVILVCFIISAYFKAHMDAIADSGIKSSEWKNKYEVDKWNRPLDVSTKNHWWYFGLYKPKYAENFPFSSTALVFTTDRWHAYQMLTYRFIYMGASFGFSENIWVVSLLTFVVLPIVVGVTFEIFYNGAKKSYYTSSKSTTIKQESIYDNKMFSEEPFSGQVTSVEEKQIEDII
jgi:hypothetical protein